MKYGMKYDKTAALVKERRQKKKMTQTELTKKIGYANAQFVSNFENGLTPIPAKTLKKIAKVLAIKRDEVREALHQDFDKFIMKELAG